MIKKRVVVTGFSAITPLGNDWGTFKHQLQTHQSAVRYMPEWDAINGLGTKLAAPVDDFQLPKHYTRKKIRTMGRVSKLAVRTSELALEQANLLDNPVLTDGRTGVSSGSCTGSTDAIQDFTNFISSSGTADINATSYIRMMSHTAPANIAMFFGLQGRVIATSTACTSGSQGIGYAFEAIQSGKQTVMVAGGAEELCPSEAAIFDTLYATSLKNDTPTETPRPFDEARDGLVIGEGACHFVLEELEFAQQRGATILAELVGFATNCDGQHATQPQAETMARVMRMSLADANLKPEQIGHVNAHGTATLIGDIAETSATQSVFSSDQAISSLKGNIGHTLGACGAIEAWASINMMNENWFAPTHNLKNVDSNCGDLHYIQGSGESINTDYVMTNNFAFGGINTSLIFKRWQ